MRDTGIADRLRDEGLHVVEVAGWQTRGNSSFNPRGSVDHHTAGPRSGNAPSLGICINGSTGRGPRQLPVGVAATRRGRHRAPRASGQPEAS